MPWVHPCAVERSLRWRLVQNTSRGVLRLEQVDEHQIPDPFETTGVRRRNAAAPSLRRSFRIVVMLPALTKNAVKSTPHEVFWSTTKDEGDLAWEMAVALEAVEKAEGAMCRPQSKLKAVVSRGSEPKFVADRAALSHGREVLAQAFTRLAESHGRQNDVGKTPAAIVDELGVALSRKDSSLVRSILERDPTLANSAIQNQTVFPLAMAVGFADVPSVKVLLDFQADVNETAELTGRTALHTAASIGSSALCSVLVGAGSRLEAKDSMGCTPLILAAISSKPQCVQLLLKRGADVRACDADGGSVVLWCARNNLGNCLRLLLRSFRSQIDLDAPDNLGDTPLHRAAEMGHAAPLKILIEAGAELDAIGADGDTPLLRATKAGSLKSVETLMLSGADYDVKNIDGASAADICRISKMNRMLNAHHGVRVRAAGRRFSKLLFHRETADLALVVQSLSPDGRADTLLPCHRFMLAAHWSNNKSRRVSLQVQPEADPRWSSLRITLPAVCSVGAATRVLELVYGLTQSIAIADRGENEVELVAQTIGVRLLRSAEGFVLPQGSISDVLKTWGRSSAVAGSPDQAQCIVPSDLNAIASLLENPTSCTDSVLTAVADARFRARADSEEVHCSFRAVLCLSSDVFRAMFTGSMKEASAADVELIVHPSFDGGDADRIVRSFARYLNTEEFEVEDEDVLGLLTVAAQFNVVRLKQLCEAVLAKSLSVDNVSGLLAFAEAYSATQLRTSCISFVGLFFSTLKSSDEFLDELASLPEACRVDVDIAIQDELAKISDERDGGGRKTAQRSEKVERNTDHW